MKKVLFLSIVIALALTSGVSAKPTLEKDWGMSGIENEKSYVAYAVPTAPTEEDWSLTAHGVIQGDVYYSETTAVDNYRLPKVEPVYIEPDAPVPIAATNDFSYII